MNLSTDKHLQNTIKINSKDKYYEIIRFDLKWLCSYFTVVLFTIKHLLFKAK